MKTTIKINLNNVETIRRFANVVRTFESGINIATSKNVEIDAKSLIGLFAMDLSQEASVTIFSSDEEEIKRFVETMGEFKCLIV